MVEAYKFGSISSSRCLFSSMATYLLLIFSDNPAKTSTSFLSNLCRRDLSIEYLPTKTFTLTAPLRPFCSALPCVLHSCLPQEATKHTPGSTPAGPRLTERPFSELDDFWTPCKLENLTITERPAHPEIQRFWIPEGVTH